MPSKTLFLLFLAVAGLAGDKPQQPQIDYMGQKLPGHEPQLFAPGFISTGLNDREPTFSPDGKSCYFWAIIGSNTVIFETHQRDGKWLPPEVATFSGVYTDFEPCISPDGLRLFFCSNRPAEGARALTHTDIQVMDKTESGWSPPRSVGTGINTGQLEFFPSVTLDGTLYFCRLTADYSRSDVYRSRLVNGVYEKATRLPAPINGSFIADNAMIAPDERFLIFNWHAPGSKTAPFHVSFRSGDSWSEPVLLDPLIPPTQSDDGARLSPDGRYLFFSANVTRGGWLDPTAKAGKRLTMSDIQAFHRGPQNGNKDIYWMATDRIKALQTPKP